MRALAVALFLLGLLCLAQSPRADMMLTGVGGGPVASAAAGYQGPGDIVSGASAWYAANQCYNTAYSGNVADVWDSTTGNTTETLITCSAGGTLNFTVNPIATTCSSGCVIKTMYDQTGSLACGGAACDVTEATLANRPTYTANALNSKACGTWTVSIALNSTNALTSIPQQFSYVAVAERTGSFTTAQRIIETSSAGTRMGFSNAGNTTSINAGSSFTAVASDSSFHALIDVFNNASSSIVVDGSATAGTAGAGASATTIEIGNETVTNSNLVGLFCEGGIWPVGLNATQYGNLNSNMHTRWNF